MSEATKAELLTRIAELTGQVEELTGQVAELETKLTVNRAETTKIVEKMRGEVRAEADHEWQQALDQYRLHDAINRTASRLLHDPADAFVYLEDWESIPLKEVDSAVGALVAKKPYLARRQFGGDWGVHGKLIPDPAPPNRNEWLREVVAAQREDPDYG